MYRKNKKKLKTAAAVFAAVLTLSAAGCGYVEELEPEQDGAGLVSQENDSEAGTDNDSQFEQPDSNADGTDDSPSDSGEVTDSQTLAPADSESDSSDMSAADSLPDDVVEVPQDSEKNSGNSYVNAEFGFTLPLPEGTTWQEFEDTEPMPAFDDAAVQFRPLMETENTNDQVISVQHWKTDKTTDDFAKEAWDRDYRNAGTDENGDTIEVLNTSNSEVGGKAAQLVTERLTGGNGEFYSASLYIAIADGEYIYMHISCYDEATLDELCGYITSTTF